MCIFIYFLYMHICIYSDNLSCILPDILSGIFSDIVSDISFGFRSGGSDILSGIDFDVLSEFV